MGVAATPDSRDAGLRHARLRGPRGHPLRQQEPGLGRRRPAAAVVARRSSRTAAGWCRWTPCRALLGPLLGKRVDWRAASRAAAHRRRAGVPRIDGHARSSPATRCASCWRRARRCRSGWRRRRAASRSPSRATSLDVAFQQERLTGGIVDARAVPGRAREHVFAIDAGPALPGAADRASRTAPARLVLEFQAAPLAAARRARRVAERRRRRPTAPGGRRRCAPWSSIPATAATRSGPRAPAARWRRTSRWPSRASCARASPTASACRPSSPATGRGGRRSTSAPPSPTTTRPTCSSPSTPTPAAPRARGAARCTSSPTRPPTTRAAGWPRWRAARSPAAAGAAAGSDLALILWDMAQAEHLEESSALATRIQEELAEVTGSQGARRQAGALPRAGGRGHARGAGGGRLHQQRRGGEAAHLRRVPEQGRGGAGARASRATSASASSAAAARRAAAAPLTEPPMSPRRANVLIAARAWSLLLVVVALDRAALVALAAPAAARRRSGAERAGREPAPAAEPEAPGSRERTISVKLFFQAADRPRPGHRGARRWRSRTTSRASSRRWWRSWSRARRPACVRTPRPRRRACSRCSSPRAASPTWTSRRRRRTADRAGSEDELLTVYSVVNSLTANFPAVKRVQILVEDRPAPTLAGHVDLTRPLPADMTFLAGAAPSPVPSRGVRRPGPAPTLVSVRPSAKAARFTESVIREMTRLAHLHGAVNLSQGFPGLPGPGGGEGGGAARDRRRHQPVRDHLGRALAARGHRAPSSSALYGVPVDPEREVTVTCGSTEAMIATLLADPRPRRRGGGASSPSTRTTARTRSSPAPRRAS